MEPRGYTTSGDTTLAAATSVDSISFCRWFATKSEWAIKPPSITTAAPLTRYGAHWGARFASEPATAEELHHVRGHDR